MILRTALFSKRDLLLGPGGISFNQNNSRSVFAMKSYNVSQYSEIIISLITLPVHVVTYWVVFLFFCCYLLLLWNTYVDAEKEFLRQSVMSSSPLPAGWSFRNDLGVKRRQRVSQSNRRSHTPVSYDGHCGINMMMFTWSCPCYHYHSSEIPVCREAGLMQYLHSSRFLSFYVGSGLRMY